MHRIQPDLSVAIASLVLRNPVIIASGVFGYGQEYNGLVDVHQIGAIITKGISLQPSQGNPPPRIVETPSGMLNAIGLHNIGYERFVQEKLPLLRQCGTTVIVNFYGTTIHEYTELARRLSDCEGVGALEANLSCPNISRGGMSFGTDPRSAARITRALRKATQLPLIIKLTPNAGSIATIARHVADAGADAVSLINTITGMVIDIDTRTPFLGNITGGLSGPAIRPVALRMVWETVQQITIPVIGIGGIMTAADALQFLIAGAQAIQIGTGLFVNPKAPEEIVAGITAYLQKHGYSRIQEIIGSLQIPTHRTYDCDNTIHDT